MHMEKTKGILKQPKKERPDRRMQRAITKVRLKRYWPLYIFVLPAVLYILIFNYGPMYGILIAFKNYNPAIGVWGSKWVGLSHFKTFFESFYFGRLMENTFALSIYTIVAGFPIPILLALMLNEVRSQRYRSTVQTIMYAPHFISMVVMVGIISTMMSPSIGVINHIIELLGGERQYFLVNPAAFRHIFVWSDVWQQMGWNAIIYTAALSTVDPEMHEAAMIDGATRIKRVLYINLPVILPTIIITLIMRLGSIATVGYEKAYLLQNDLNQQTSEIISTYVYKRGLLGGQFSLTTAIGLFNNIINVTMLLIANRLAAKFSDTSLF